jgi:hypothetical protein
MCSLAKQAEACALKNRRFRERHGTRDGGGASLTSSPINSPG